MKTNIFGHKLILILSVVVIFLTTFYINSNHTRDAFAADTKNYQEKQESINPDYPLRYKFKRLLEKAQLTYLGIFNKKQKVPYLLKLTDRRLAELKYIVDNSKRSYLETSSSRYVTFIGLISNELLKNKNYAPQVQSAIEGHTEILTRLRDNFSHETAEWRFMEQAVESSKVLLSEAQ